jgi:hypothetical protein
MAILEGEEPPAKRRRLTVVPEPQQQQVVEQQPDHHHVDTLNTLIRDLSAVAPWEIIATGIPLYQRLYAATANITFLTPATIMAATTQRLYHMLLQHLEICLSWTATDTDECDDADRYVTAVTGIVQCLQQIYAPELDDDNNNEQDDDDDDSDDDEEEESSSSSSSLSLWFRTLGFLLQHNDVDVDVPSSPCGLAVEAILHIVRFRLGNTAAAAVWNTFSTIQQLDGLVILVRVVASSSSSSKSAMAILTTLQQQQEADDDFAKIALETIQPQRPMANNDVPVQHPRTRTATLFAWRCQLLLATAASTRTGGDTTTARWYPHIATMVKTLRNVILPVPPETTTQQHDEHHVLSLDRTLALDCLVSLSSQQPTPEEDDDDEARALLLRQLVLDLLSCQELRLSTACGAVTALQNLLAIHENGDNEDNNNDNADEVLFPYFDALPDPHTFLSVLQQISQSCRERYNTLSSSQERFMPANNCQDVSVWAMELFWSFVSVAIRRVGDSDDDDETTSVGPAIAALALSAVDDGCRSDEYKLYLAARTICRDHPTYFQTQSDSLPALVTALAIILRDAESSAVTKDYVISFFQTLVRESDDASLRISQDRDVLDVIAQMGATGENDEASKLLFELSDYVPNRLRLVQRPRVLFAMMRFAQRQQRQAEQNSNDEGRYYQRRIGQLAELL